MSVNLTLGEGLTIGSGITFGAGTGGGGGGGGGGAGGGAVALNIAGVSGSTVPDTSGGGNNGTLTGSYSTGSDSHGSYIQLNGGYIDLAGYNLTTPFTVRLVASLTPTGFWATLWGNEFYGASQGYAAYLTSSSYLGAGPVSDTGFFTVSNINNIAQWDFVVDSTYNVLVYKNGSQVGSTYASSAPSGGDATNDLYIGARHQNFGSSYTDACNMKVYAVNIFTSALSGATIASDYTTNQSTFSI